VPLDGTSGASWIWAFFDIDDSVPFHPIASYHPFALLPFYELCFTSSFLDLPLSHIGALVLGVMCFVASFFLLEVDLVAWATHFFPLGLKIYTLFLLIYAIGKPSFF